jgi:hypothetical protein
LSIRTSLVHFYSSYIFLKQFVGLLHQTLRGGSATENFNFHWHKAHGYGQKKNPQTRNQTGKNPQIGELFVVPPSNSPSEFATAL